MNTAIDWTEPTWWTQWGDLFALTHGRYSQQVIALGTTSTLYKDSKGTGPEITRAALEAAHGKPTAVTVTFMGPRGPSWQTVIYDEIGLAGAVRTEPDTVPEFFVFRPGTARTIWKF